eukprot:3686213-Rhodomonas_salina.3
MLSLDNDSGTDRAYHIHATLRAPYHKSGADLVRVLVSGQLVIAKAELLPRVRTPTFLDYVQGGMEITLSVAVDFTASNAAGLVPFSTMAVVPFMPAVCCYLWRQSCCLWPRNCCLWRCLLAVKGDSGWSYHHLLRNAAIYATKSANNGGYC